MKSNQFSIGMVVEVLCGRDQGKLMMVLSIVDETYVRLVDGVGRTLDKPKLQSLPASVSFPMRWLFASGGQSIGVSASASVFPMNNQD